MSLTPEQANFRETCSKVAALCAAVEGQVRLLTPTVSELPIDVQFQEVNANLMLAVRHLEDARFRLDHAIKWGCMEWLRGCAAAGGGKS